MKKLFDCNDSREVKEYIGTKVDVDKDNKTIRLMQPVLIQSFVDKFGVSENSKVTTLAAPGKVLRKCPLERKMSHAQHKKYRKGVRKLMYLAHWTRPDILNVVRDLSRHAQYPGEEHYQAMQWCMIFCINTKEVAIELKAEQEWDGGKSHKFRVEGYGDSSTNQCPDTGKSVTGATTTLEGALVITRMHMQSTVKLSATKSELDSTVTTAQDMLYIKDMVESMELEVETPMALWSDNKGVVDIANG